MAKNAFQLKGTSFTLMVLQLQTPDLANVHQQLTQLAKQTPKFFHHSPIVIDLQKLPHVHGLDFNALKNTLAEVNVVPVGVCNANSSLQEVAIQAGLAILPHSKAEPSVTIEETTKPTPASAPADLASASHSKIINQPVRSGQQIYSKGDLIVTAPVSVGAELLAEGHIHVYGPLRGRALAGANGNKNARIFCQQLEAELVAVAGHYWVSEDLSKQNLKNNVQIFLDNDRLQILDW